MTPGEMVARLEALSPADLQAVDLVLEFNRADVADVAAFADRQDEIEQALTQLQSHARRVEEIGRRCQHLMAIPARHLPPGF